jgi:hypothetical protein
MLPLTKQSTSSLWVTGQSDSLPELLVKNCLKITAPRLFFYSRIYALKQTKEMNKRNQQEYSEECAFHLPCHVK